MRTSTTTLAILPPPLAAAAAVAALTAMAAMTPPQDADPGEAIFRGRGNCFTCHAPTATGTPLGPDLTDDVWTNFDRRPTRAEVSALVKAGVPVPREHPAPMPPMGGGRLSAEEIDQVAAWVLSLSAGASDSPGDPPADPRAGQGPAVSSSWSR